MGERLSEYLGRVFCCRREVYVAYGVGILFASVTLRDKVAMCFLMFLALLATCLSANLFAGDVLPESLADHRAQ